jgi:hypothetical protein
MLRSRVRDVNAVKMVSRLGYGFFSGWSPAGNAEVNAGPQNPARGASLADAISSVPAWAIVGATIAHLLTLGLRTGAWRVRVGAPAPVRL